MKIILTEEKKMLRGPGDVGTVKEGYARNYLLPKGKARPATDENMKLLAALKAKAALEENARVDQAKGLADKISSISLTISAQAGEEEKLYGSVTGEMISEALEAEGFVIDKRDI